MQLLLVKVKIGDYTFLELLESSSSQLHRYLSIFKKIDVSDFEKKTTLNLPINVSFSIDSFNKNKFKQIVVLDSIIGYD